jgi:2,3-bisphosphoglycerate-independent phosphoglycerate mutase
VLGFAGGAAVGELRLAGAAPLSRVPDGRGPLSAGGREEAVGRAGVLGRARLGPQ